MRQRCEPEAKNCAGLGLVTEIARRWKAQALLAAQYREQGLNLLQEFSHYVEGTGQKSVSVEAGLMDMLQRMESGRFKVFKHLNDWFEEFRLFHRKDGKVVKEGD